MKLILKLVKQFLQGSLLNTEESGSIFEVGGWDCFMVAFPRDRSTFSLCSQGTLNGQASKFSVWTERLNARILNWSKTRPVPCEHCLSLLNSRFLCRHATLFPREKRCVAWRHKNGCEGDCYARTMLPDFATDFHLKFSHTQCEKIVSRGARLRQGFLFLVQYTCTKEL